MTQKDFQITPSQTKAARALLGWNQQELADRAKVGASTVADFERGKRSPVPNNLEAIRCAFEAADITFLAGGAIVAPPPEIESSILAPGGKPVRLVDATDLSQWAERLDSKAVFPELISRLILASTGNSVKQLHFPATESIQQESWDGICEQYSIKELPWLPIGVSGWELSTQRAGIQGKANGDYSKRTTDPGEVVQQTSTFMFATLKRWAKGPVWAKSKRDERSWGDVRIIDADDLVQWIELYPSVGYWLASHIRKLPSGILPLLDAWYEWKRSTNWPLTPEIVLAGRDDEAIEILKWLRGKPTVRSLQADSPDEAIAFLYAAIDLLPDPHRKLYLMRSLRVYSAEAARILGNSPSPLIVLMESSEPGLASRLAEQGHHVLIAYGSAVGSFEVNTVLPRAQHDAFQSALENMGIPEGKAVELTRDSIRSVAVLRRLIPGASVTIPEWAEEQKARFLIPALLAGGWDAGREADRLALEELSGQKFESFDSQCTALTGFPDAPLRHAGTSWKIASPRDAWFRLAKFIGRSDLDRFAKVAKSVLGAADPRFEISPDERWLAGIRGQLPKHSAWFSAGVSETLLLLAMFPERVNTVSNAGQYSNSIVRDLLADADAKRWYSLSRQLRTLAEAAPDEFLSAVENSLAQTDMPVMTLFQEDGGLFLGGGANHSELLWALEILAWSPQYLSRVSEILARLDALDPGGKWANRPKSSLRTIFLLWKPQTHATLAERTRVLDHLREVEPDAAWKLMLSLLPAGYDTMSPTPQPRWRDFSVTQQEEVTNGLITSGADAISKRLVEDVGANTNRWVQLIEALPNLVPEWRKEVLAKLAQVTAMVVDDSSRMPIWAALRRLLSHHRSFPDAPWRMPDNELNEIESVYQKFQPDDEINQRIWLFSNTVEFVSGRRGDDWNARTEEEFAKRRNAISEIIASCGPQSLQRVAKESAKPHLAGIAYGQQVEDASEANAVLDEFLNDPDQPVREFVYGLVAALHERFGPTWAKELLDAAREHNWSCSRTLEILLALPCGSETWKLVDSLGEEIRSEYWQKASVIWIREGTEQTIYGVCQLLSARRGRAAVRLIAGSQVRLPADLTIQMLQEATEEHSFSDDINDPVMFQWSVCQLLRQLDENPEVPEAQVAQLEWIYLALLERSERPPAVLHRFISRDPAFFVEVLSAIYRPHSESQTDKQSVPEGTKLLASHAFTLLQSWNVLPGTRDGQTDAASLKAWVKEAHRLAVLAERGAVGDVYIGRILSYAKADPGGIWPEKAVRDVIDEIRNDHIDSGIVSGVHNKRGVTSRGLLDGGAQERGIANRYRSWADAVKLDSPRTAALLERIARTFDESATFHDEHAEFTDWTY